MKDLNKKRKIDEAGSSNLTSKEEELRLLIEPLAKPVLVNLLSKLGSKDPSIAAEIETIAYGDHVHRKLFVRDLSLNTTSQSLCNAFKEYGQIEHAKVIVNEGTKKSRGYGYILYKDVKSAKKALHVPSKLIDGRLTLCMLASDEVTRKISDTTLRKLFIENLSPQVTNGMLHNYFKGHGDIEECSVVYHKDSKLSREYGFVTYKTVEAAKNAIKDLNKSTLEGRRINVEYAYPNKGGGGQSSVPSGQSSVPPMAALPVPPGYTYPQTAALYAAPPYTYPQTAAPPYSYPQTAAPSNPYPQTAATPNPYPQTAAPYVAPPYPYPQMPAPYAASHYNSAPPGPSTYQTHGYGQGPYPQQYYQNQ